VTWNWRWSVVAGLVAVLCAAPAAVGALPAGHSDLSASRLLAMVQGSGSAAYSGYAEADGGLSLPVTDQFSSVANILGGQTQLRVWWRGSADWRVDTIATTGENDERLNGNTLQSWDYESNSVTETTAAPAKVRLPDPRDVLPSSLAQRLLSEATPAEVSRLPSRRVAGRDAPGFALRPPQAGSTINEVDVWVDPADGVALRVDVRGAGSNVISTQFLNFSTAVPDSSTVNFVAPPGLQVRTSQNPDLVQLINGLGTGHPPASLAGIARNPALPEPGSIGVYGGGVTEFAVVPLFGRTARSLRSQLAKTAGVSTTSTGQGVAVGALSLVLTGPSKDGLPGRGDGGWLLVGTVTVAKLVTAANALLGGGS
jgi:hypothetical protein